MPEPLPGASDSFCCASPKGLSVSTMIPSYNYPQFKTTSLHALARANGRARDILKGDFTPLQGI
jgi:hypothetical protein